MIYINLNMVFYTHVEHSHIKTISIKCYIHMNKKQQHKNVMNLNIYDTDLYVQAGRQAGAHTHMHARRHTHTHTHTHMTVVETGY